MRIILLMLLAIVVNATALTVKKDKYCMTGEVCHTITLKHKGKKCDVVYHNRSLLYTSCHSFGKYIKCIDSKRLHCKYVTNRLF